MLFQSGWENLLPIPRTYIPWPAGNGSVSEVSFQWSPLPGVQRVACLLPESLEVSVCAERQYWPVSSQCSSEILSYIGKRGREPRNIFKLALPVYHGLDGSLGVFGLPEWGSSSGTKNLPLGNSHHPSSVLMAPSALASHFWASVYFGESSISSGSSANMRALTGASLVTLKPSAACLVALSASLFPEPGGYPLFDVLSSV